MKNLILFREMVLFIVIVLFNVELSCAQENSISKNTTVNSNKNLLETNKAKDHLSNLLVQNTSVIKLLVGNNNYSSVTTLGNPTEIKTYEDHIEFIFKDNKAIVLHTINLFYADILEEIIKSKNVTSNKDDGSTVTEHHLKLGNISLVTTLENSFLMKLLINDFTVIQKKLNEERFMMDVFRKMAAEYHSLKEKPAISEEQRKYIVQANAFAKIMEYDEAISYYIKVLNSNGLSFPEAYFNLALLLGQTNRYNAAISFMNKYLLLVPNSSDASTAKNKIKDWEIMLQHY